MNKDSHLIITLDSSQIKNFLYCPQAWTYSYLENLRKVGASTKPLNRGSAIHLLLEGYYRLKAMFPFDPISRTGETAIQIFKDLKQWEKLGLTEDEVHFIIQRFRQYCLKYSLTYDFIPRVSAEGDAAVEVGFSKKIAEYGNATYIITGKIDLLAEYDGNDFMVVDHKSQSRISELYPFIPQFMTYALVTGATYGCINYFGVQDTSFNAEKHMRRTLFKIPKHKIRQWEHLMLKAFNGVEAIIRGAAPEQKIENCGGPLGSMPCVFSELCDTESDKLRETLKNNLYTKVEAWKPWSLTEIS